MPNQRQHKDVLLFSEMAVNALAREGEPGQVALPGSARDTGPDGEVWRALKGELSAADLVELRIRDAAVARPWLFDIARLLGHSGWEALRRVPERSWENWRARAEARSELPAQEFLTWAAERLLPPGPKWGPSLPPLERHQTALELPGTGGLFAYRMIQQSGSTYLQDNYVIWTGSWREALFAGMVALEVGMPGTADVPTVAASDVGGVPGKYDVIVGASASHAARGDELRSLLRPGGELVLV